MEKNKKKKTKKQGSDEPEILQQFYQNFPPEILTNLVLLDLSNRSLVECPELNAFRNLQELDLSHNKIQRLKSRTLVGQLPLLQKLDVSFNELFVITDLVQLGYHKNLRSLSVRGNPLPISENRLILIGALLLGEDSRGCVERREKKRREAIKKYLSSEINILSESPYEELDEDGKPIKKIKKRSKTPYGVRKGDTKLPKRSASAQSLIRSNSAEKKEGTSVTASPSVSASYSFSFSSDGKKKNKEEPPPQIEMVPETAVRHVFERMERTFSHKAAKTITQEILGHQWSPREAQHQKEQKQYELNTKRQQQLLLLSNNPSANAPSSSSSSALSTLPSASFYAPTATSTQSFSSFCPSPQTTGRALPVTLMPPSEFKSVVSLTLMRKEKEREEERKKEIAEASSQAENQLTFRSSSSSGALSTPVLQKIRIKEGGGTGGENTQNGITKPNAVMPLCEEQDETWPDEPAKGVKDQGRKPYSQLATPNNYSSLSSSSASTSTPKSSSFCKSPFTLPRINPISTFDLNTTAAIFGSSARSVGPFPSLQDFTVKSSSSLSTPLVNTCSPLFAEANAKGEASPYRSSSFSSALSFRQSTEMVSPEEAEKGKKVEKYIPAPPNTHSTSLTSPGKRDDETEEDHYPISRSDAVPFLPTSTSPVSSEQLPLKEGYKQIPSRIRHQPNCSIISEEMNNYLLKNPPPESYVEKEREERTSKIDRALPSDLTREILEKTQEETKGIGFGTRGLYRNVFNSTPEDDITRSHSVPPQLSSTLSRTPAISSSSRFEASSAKQQRKMKTMQGPTVPLYMKSVSDTANLQKQLKKGKENKGRKGKGEGKEGSKGGGEEGNSEENRRAGGEKGEEKGGGGNGGKGQRKAFQSATSASISAGKKYRKIPLVYSSQTQGRIRYFNYEPGVTSPTVIRDGIIKKTADTSFFYCDINTAPVPRQGLFPMLTELDGQTITVDELDKAKNWMKDNIDAKLQSNAPSVFGGVEKVKPPTSHMEAGVGLLPSHIISQHQNYKQFLINSLKSEEELRKRVKYMLLTGDIRDDDIFDEYGNMIKLKSEEEKKGGGLNEESTNKSQKQEIHQHFSDSVTASFADKEKREKEKEERANKLSIPSPSETPIPPPSQLWWNEKVHPIPPPSQGYFGDTVQPLSLYNSQKLSPNHSTSTSSAQVGSSSSPSSSSSSNDFPSVPLNQMSQDERVKILQERLLITLASEDEGKNETQVNEQGEQKKKTGAEGGTEGDVSIPLSLSLSSFLRQTQPASSLDGKVNLSNTDQSKDTPLSPLSSNVHSPSTSQSPPSNHVFSTLKNNRLKMQGGGEGGNGTGEEKGGLSSSWKMKKEVGERGGSVGRYSTLHGGQGGGGIVQREKEGGGGGGKQSQKKTNSPPPLHNYTIDAQPGDDDDSDSNTDSAQGKYHSDKGKGAGKKKKAEVKEEKFPPLLIRLYQQTYKKPVTKPYNQLSPRMDAIGYSIAPKDTPETESELEGRAKASTVAIGEEMKQIGAQLESANDVVQKAKASRERMDEFVTKMPGCSKTKQYMKSIEQDNEQMPTPRVSFDVLKYQPSLASSALHIPCPSRWRSYDVALWLGRIGLPQYADTPQFAAMTGFYLVTMSNPDDLRRELNVQNPEHRQHMWTEIEKLKLNPDSPQKVLRKDIMRQAQKSENAILGNPEDKAEENKDKKDSSHTDISNMPSYTAAALTNQLPQNVTVSISDELWSDFRDRRNRSREEDAKIEERKKAQKRRLAKSTLAVPTAYESLRIRKSGDLENPSNNLNGTGGKSGDDLLAQEGQRSILDRYPLSPGLTRSLEFIRSVKSSLFEGSDALVRKKREEELEFLARLEMRKEAELRKRGLSQQTNDDGNLPAKAGMEGSSITASAYSSLGFINKASESVNANSSSNSSNTDAFSRPHRQKGRDGFWTTDFSSIPFEQLDEAAAHLDIQNDIDFSGNGSAAMSAAMMKHMVSVDKRNEKINQSRKQWEMHRQRLDQIKKKGRVDEKSAAALAQQYHPVSAVAAKAEQRMAAQRVNVDELSHILTVSMRQKYAIKAGEKADVFDAANNFDTSGSVNSISGGSGSGETGTRGIDFSDEVEKDAKQLMKNVNDPIFRLHQSTLAAQESVKMTNKMISLNGEFFAYSPVFKDVEENPIHLPEADSLRLVPRAWAKKHSRMFNSPVGQQSPHFHTPKSAAFRSSKSSTSSSLNKTSLSSSLRTPPQIGPLNTPNVNQRNS